KRSSPDTDMTDSDESKSSKKDKKERKKEKKEKKERKAKEKEEKKKRREAEKAAATSGGVLAVKAEPAGFVNQTGRHALRHRFIAAKRKAVMDDAALNEV